ncbi:F-box/kelch-repeat protein At3g23880-like isoform X2 [Durio zibethinus]|uniref:F-box/kelch-repeat protein At3g23880-like isoform X2 n=1 Tax=Durio zibethinus TaxID=66656 RepID=A0A6P5ZGQ3_DURZI|nr:F-box/kelch-repeat protein At3g23880-like isoform X2 [Durio zibethinus]
MAVDANLPEDVTFEILARLPVKSLKRFQCIQKSWLALIQSPEFASAHFTFSKAKAYPLVKRDSDFTRKPIISLLSNETLDVKVDLDIPNLFGRNARCIRIQGSCINGIVCLWSDDDIVIWNPATKEFKVISDLEVDNLVREPYSCSLILTRFNYYWDAVGFSHDSETDDYKVASNAH